MYLCIPVRENGGGLAEKSDWNAEIEKFIEKAVIRKVQASTEKIVIDSRASILFLELRERREQAKIYIIFIQRRV